MKNYTFALCLLMSSFAIAQECKLGDGTVLKDGEKHSLTDKDEKLANHKTQDQDGLGTCYANAASVMLKSVLPEAPDVSYTHAAIVGSSQANWKEGKGEYVRKFKSNKKGVKDEYEDFTSGGTMCSTFNALQKNGGACAKSDSILENRALLSQEAQVRVMTGLGSYFDHLNKLKKAGKDEQVESLNKDLSAAIDFLKKKKEDLKKECASLKAQKYPINSAIKDFVTEIGQLSIFEFNQCDKSKLKALKKLSTSDSVINKDNMNVKPSEKLFKDFQTIVESDPEIGKGIEAYLAHQEKKPSDEDLVVAEKLGNKLNEALLKVVPNSELEGCTPATEGASAFIDSPKTLGRSFFLAIRADKENKCDDVYISENLKGFEKDKNLNCSPGNLKIITAALAPIVEVGENIDDKLLSALANTNAVNAEQLIGVLSPACKDPKNLFNLENLKCEEHSMCAEEAQVGVPNNYAGPKPKGKKFDQNVCYSKEDSVKVFQTNIISAIKKKSVTSLAVCTSFFVQPGKMTKHCNKKVDGVPGHDLHEVVVSGYRCSGGKVEYQLINSWGTSCPVKDKLKNDFFECDTTKEGNTNGRFWVKEDIIVDSTISLSNVKGKDE